MASTYSDLKIELIGTGDQAGQWGNTTNTNLGTAIEEAITGTADVTFSSTDVSLTLTDTNASQAARNLRLNLIGTSGGARNLTVPNIEKLYIVNNALADTVTVRNSTGATVGVPSGSSTILYSTGTGIVSVLTQFVGNVTGNLTGNVTGNISGGTVAGSTGTFSGAISGASVSSTGDVTIGGAAVINSRAQEKATVVSTAATGTIQFDCITQSLLFYTQNATGNWTLNVRGNSGSTLNSILSTGQSISIVFMVTNGSTPYYQTNMTIDGVGVTPKWQGGSAPGGGTASSIDVYSFVIIKTASNVYTVLAAQVNFA